LRKINKVVVLVGILGFYAFLYIATSKPYHCEGDCEKLERVGFLLKEKSSVQYSYGAERDLTFNISVYDSTQTIWTGLADTACNYLLDHGLKDYKVSVTKYRNPLDTLAKRQCP
jgi:hypothetical protein